MKIAVVGAIDGIVRLRQVTRLDAHIDVQTRLFVCRFREAMCPAIPCFHWQQNHYLTH